MENQSTEKTLKFKAEVKQLLDIVINSLYTDKDIFIRELVSNAADALEKQRHLSLTENATADKDIPLEIHIETDEKENTITFTDSGIGMTKEEASTNLGTIAHSGSREFLKQMAEGQQIDATLIGQFGVGFYSAFTVAEEVIVKSKSYLPGETGVQWRSDGSGSFKVSEVDLLKRGTSITVKLRESEKRFSDKQTVKNLILRYSNFVPFPIFIDKEQVNTVQAIWAKSKNDVSEEDYEGFYRFLNPGGDKPYYKLHFTADAPLAIKALLFFPDENPEIFGFGRIDPGVNLYCRKVLIQQRAKELLPEYFRFIKGVVDSEDLPLNISRETMQDSALIAKLKRVLTKRLIKHLEEEAKNDPERYAGFFRKFGSFIKEGIYTEFDSRNDLAALLRYDSSAMTEGKLTSLAEYVSRMKGDQKAIYFITGASRESVEAAPYLEALKTHEIEVLYLYEGIDDLVMTSLREFDGKKLTPVDSADLDLPENAPAEEKQDKKEEMPEREAGDLARWIKDFLGDKISEVRISKRLTSSPALIVNPDDMMTTNLQRALAASQGKMDFSNLILEINPSHAILQKLNGLRVDKTNWDFAKDAAWMLYDNAMLSAGLPLDPKMMVDRNTKILERAFGTSE